MKPARNDLCSCGSGKKYKHCCEGKAAPRAAGPSPDEFNPLVTLFNTGRFAELEIRARALAGRYPASGLVWKLLGASLQMQGKNALAVLQKTVGLMPNDAEVHFNLGVIQASLGQSSDAVISFRRVLAIKPNYPLAQYLLGNVLWSIGQLEAAVTCYSKAIEHKPEHADAHYNLGNVLRDLGSFDGAVTSYRRYLMLKPDSASAYNNLGSALRSSGNLEAAIESYRKAVAIKPDYFEAHSNIGHVLQDLGQLEDALKSYRRALEINPVCTGAMLGMGLLHTVDGEMAKAEEAFLGVLEIDSNNLSARLQLAGVQKVRPGDENLAALIATEEAVRNNRLSMPYDQKVFLHFVLGDCFDDLGEHDKAFPHFLEGCRLKRATFVYDAKQMTRHFDEVIRVFDQKTVDRLCGGGNPSKAPIFVLGMPRSGTTLTEQIISSHPEVYGAGELPDMVQIAHRAAATTMGFPGNILALDRRNLTQWADDYVAALHRRAPDARYITDKMPDNFMFIGLIHAMLPNARIIHVNRNPVDTCLSCFTKLFGGPLKHTYDLAELGRYYVDYARLMDHWRCVLPAGSFLDVQYEDIVADQEAQTRRMLDFCGLEWNDACLDFYKQKRSIDTASLAQVRRPIYKSSMERWRPYEKYLGPLLDALGDLSPKRN